MLPMLLRLLSKFVRYYYPNAARSQKLVSLQKKECFTPERVNNVLKVVRTMVY